MITKVPVNIFSGYLGAGKTTIISSLIKNMDDASDVVWLKNEYGDENVDALMLSETDVIPAEILNGCLCCVLVGRLEVALEQIIAEYSPTRIIIETSGTAWPGPIVREVSRLEKLSVDSVIYVVDCQNFSGFDDKSYAAKLQNEAVDKVVLNKYPANEAEITPEFEQELDDVYEIFPHTPKYQSVTGEVPANELLGLAESTTYGHTDVTLEHDPNEHPDHVQTKKLVMPGNIEMQKLSDFLLKLKDKGVVRVKGVVNDGDQSYLVNSSFGDSRYTLLPEYSKDYYLVFFAKDFMGIDIDLSELSN